MHCSAGESHTFGFFVAVGDACADGVVLADRDAVRDSDCERVPVFVDVIVFVSDACMCMSGRRGRGDTKPLCSASRRIGVTGSHQSPVPGHYHPMASKRTVIDCVAVIECVAAELRVPVRVPDCDLCAVCVGLSV